MAANTGGQPLLQTFQKHIEDMRSLVMCKICIKPLYEPFVLACGHSYCYSCLTSWFTGGNEDRRRRQNMKCPDCRAAVVLEPSPNYVLRDLVHMFISRTELLSEDETTNEHEMAKAEEAVQMTTDRTGGGLFKGVFRRHGSFRRHNVHELLANAARAAQGPMHDPHDNVDRCPECHWELEGGRCNQCEWSISDEDFSDDSSGSEEDSERSVGEINFNHGRRPFERVRVDPMQSPTPSFLDAFDEERRALGVGRPRFGRNGSVDGDSVITISSDIDDVDPVDHLFADEGEDTHSEAESDLPAAMGGGANHNHLDFHRFGPRARYRGGYESDIPSTNYDDSEMGDTNLGNSSEAGDSDDDVDETEDDTSEMEGFIEHDTPTHVPHRGNELPRQRNEEPEVYISSSEDESDDERNTDREQSQALTTTTVSSVTRESSATNASSSDESSEDESRRTPVPLSRPARQTRVILDDSDEDQGQEKSDSDDSNGDESDATTIPARSTASRQSHLRGQRARRQTNTIRQTLVSPTRRPDVPSRGGFGNGSGRHHPYPLQATTGGRRSMRPAYVAG